MELRQSKAYALALAVPLSVLVMLALGSRPTVAQGMGGYEQPHMVRFGIAGGAVVPTSNAREALKTGVHGQAFVLLNLLQGIPLRLNLGYQRMSLKDALAAGQSGASGGTQSILAGVAGTQIDLLRGPVRPYIVAGVGGFDVRNNLDALAGSTASSTSQLKFGIDGGAGLSLKLGRLAAFVEGRVQNVYANGALANAKSIQSVPVSFGLLF